jgi:hypothetical protein
MTHIKIFPILLLAAVILTLGSPSQISISAARQAEAPNIAPRFVVFEAFLNPV